MADNVGKDGANTSSELDDSANETTALSMVDVLADEKQLEDDANAVLGASDDKNCTYSLGYVPRQALYACMTCIDTNSAVLAGVCLACCLECHESHELIELYTKRNFKCDCGNSKFGNTKCKLYANKNKVNNENIYNQNFKGKYCTCARPFPDPEDDIEDEMMQCTVCEDWLHGRHLNSSIPENGNYEEMICEGCIKKCDFLWVYSIYCTDTKKVDNGDTSEPVSVDTSPVKRDDGNSAYGDALKPTGSNLAPGTSNSKSQETENFCKRADLSKRKISKHAGATFWEEGWRSKLCTCTSCMAMYRELRVTFLIDDNDSIKAYEERGKELRGSQYESGMQLLSNMDRVQQVEMIHGYNDMKSELTDYLKKFAENKKVVKEEDVREFFQQLASRKKQKTSNTPQYFCK